MSQQFRTVTTNAGRNAVREALTQGKTVKLSHMSVGDGGGNPVTPLSTMTKLVNERFRAQINDIVLDPATPDLFTAELFIPQAEGGWYIREVGLWMDDGTLFAVGNTPLTEKPDISSGAATDLLVRLIIRVLDAATVSIEIDPAQVLATREYVDRKLDAHNKDGGAHETLARKSVQIKAGTGLTGGGTLEADRTLTVKYGNTAGTARQGKDGRPARAPAPKTPQATPPTRGAGARHPPGHRGGGGPETGPPPRPAEAGRQDGAASLLLAEAVLCFLVPISLIVWMVVNQVQDITLRPDLIITPLKHIAALIHEKTGYNLWQEENISSMIGMIPKLGQWVVSSIFDFGINIVVLLFVLYFMLIGGLRMEEYCREILPFNRDVGSSVMREVHMIVRSNAIGIPLLAVVQGIVAFVGYLVFNAPSPRDRQKSRMPSSA